MNNNMTTELKAKAYELIRQINFLQQQLAQLEQEIFRQEQKPQDNAFQVSEGAAQDLN